MENWFRDLIDSAYRKQKESLFSIGKCEEEVACSSFNTVIQSLKQKKVLIYGAGSFGKEMLKLLLKNNVEVKAFLDVNALNISSVSDLPVYCVDDENIHETLKKDCLVLFSIVMDKSERKQALEYIRNCGFPDVIEAQSIRCLLILADDSNEKEVDFEYLMAHKVSILKASGLFADIESANIYMCNVKAHVSRNYNKCIEYPMSEQYFPEDIKLCKGFRRFVDCGGYVGDTLEKLADRYNNVEKAISFEPERENFRKLLKKAEDLSGRIDEIFLYPCAVSDRTCMTSFLSNGGSSMLLDGGGDQVLSVALDDVLAGFSPTFIKMDIEGQEPAALQGAQKLITRSRPDLAISLYHCINHIWEIPLLLDSWDLGYKFYLRTYNACTMETILYATSEDA